MLNNEKFSLTEKISSNQLFSDFFSKTITFTKFLRKKYEREFLQFPHTVRSERFFVKAKTPLQILQKFCKKNYINAKVEIG